MKISGHRLVDDADNPVTLTASPNTSGAFSGGNPRILVMHYTAGSTTNGDISWMTNPSAPGKPSAHLVIGRDGAITQLVRFNTVANHAGAGTYKGAAGMNGRSIGIELSNAGKLKLVGSSWKNDNGVAVASSKVSQAPHKYDGIMSGWEAFPQIQMNQAISAARAICSHFGITDICGHDDFAAYRGKRDPGPLFPMSEFIARVLGSDEGAATSQGLFRVWANNGLNLRSGPSTDSSKVDRKPNPLPQGTLVRALQQSGQWLQVSVIDNNGNDDDTGWCHIQYLERA